MCTSITFKSLDGDVYLGRTQEYHIPYNYIGIKTPRNYKVNSILGSWDAFYSVLGVGYKESESEAIAHVVIDGVNEFGLGGVSQYFSEFNKYAHIKEITQAMKKPILAEQFVFWVLANCKDTHEIEIKILDVAIADIASNGFGSGLPQHFMFSDSNGRTIVVEPSKDLGFDVYENPIGVMTNSPKFDWHITNLENYTGLSANNSGDMIFGDLKIPSAGKGSGFMGLPGDYTPASRFVRAAYLLKYSDAVSSEESINKAFHILETADIVKGVIKLNLSEHLNLHYTHYTSAYDLTRKTLYLKIYENILIQKIQFNDINPHNIIPYELIKEQQYEQLN